MSDAGGALRDALIAAMQADPVLADLAGLGVEPGRGTLPRIAIDWPLSTDWGTKTEVGRELRTFVTVRVAKGQRARLPDISAAIETVGVSIEGVIGAWRVVSAVFARTRVFDDANDERVAQVEHRIRVLAI